METQKKRKNRKVTVRFVGFITKVRQCGLPQNKKNNLRSLLEGLRCRTQSTSHIQNYKTITSITKIPVALSKLSRLSGQRRRTFNKSDGHKRENY